MFIDDEQSPEVKVRALQSYSTDRLGGWAEARTNLEKAASVKKGWSGEKAPVNYVRERGELTEAKLKARVFLLRAVVEEVLQHKPTQVVEVATGGDVSAVMAFPESRVITVNDHGPGENALPPEIVNAKKKGWDIFRKADPLGDFKKIYPNWEERIGDATQTGLPDNSSEIVLIQNWGSAAIGFEKEMIRLVAPGGMVVTADTSNDVIGSYEMGSELVLVNGLKPITLSESFDGIPGVRIKVWKKEG